MCGKAAVKAWLLDIARGTFRDDGGAPDGAPERHRLAIDDLRASVERIGGDVMLDPRERL